MTRRCWAIRDQRQPATHRAKRRCSSALPRSTLGRCVVSAPRRHRSNPARPLLLASYDPGVPGRVAGSGYPHLAGTAGTTRQVLLHAWATTAEIVCCEALACSRTAAPSRQGVLTLSVHAPAREPASTRMAPPAFTSPRACRGEHPNRPTSTRTARPSVCPRLRRYAQHARSHKDAYGAAMRPGLWPGSLVPAPCRLCSAAGDQASRATIHAYILARIRRP